MSSMHTKYINFTWVLGPVIKYYLIAQNHICSGDSLGFIDTYYLNVHTVCLMIY